MTGTQQCSISEVNNNGNCSIQTRIKYSLLGPLQTEKSVYLCGSSSLLRDAHRITGSQEQVGLPSPRHGCSLSQQSQSSGSSSRHIGTTHKATWGVPILPATPANTCSPFHVPVHTPSSALPTVLVAACCTLNRQEDAREK